jgi:hypothetical protein
MGMRKADIYCDDLMIRCGNTQVWNVDWDFRLSMSLRYIIKNQHIRDNVILNQCFAHKSAHICMAFFATTC